MDNFTKKKKVFSSVNKLTIVTPSNWLAGLVTESYLSEYDTRVINNGIDINVFKPTPSDIRVKYKIGAKKMVLGLAMSISKRKGVDYWIELGRKLSKEDFTIVIVGVSKEQRKLFDSSVICIERTSDQQELAAFYSAADVFVNPTLEDNYPTTNLEAISCGTPVITFNTGGSPESVDEYTGEVVEQKKLTKRYVMQFTE